MVTHHPPRVRVGCSGPLHSVVLKLLSKLCVGEPSKKFVQEPLSGTKLVRRVHVIFGGAHLR